MELRSAASVEEANRHGIITVQTGRLDGYPLDREINGQKEGKKGSWEAKKASEEGEPIDC